MFEKITAAVAVLGLLGSLVSLFYSRKALSKADQAISIEKATHAIGMLRVVVDEIDNWETGHNSKKEKLFGSYNEFVDDLPDSYRTFHWEIILSINKFYERIKGTYPNLVPKIFLERDDKFENDMRNLMKSDHKKYTDANYKFIEIDGEMIRTENYWDDAELRILEEEIVILKHYRNYIIREISKRLDNIL